MDELRLSPAALAAAVDGATAALAPKLSDPDASAWQEHGVPLEWFEPLRDPTYVFRIERAVAGFEAAQSFYVNLPALRCIRVLGETDGSYRLTAMAVEDVIYSGLVEAAGIWPDTHPELEADAEPDVDGALTVTLVVLRAEEDGGFTEDELSWLDLDDAGVWLVEEGRLVVSSDLELFQRIPLLLHVLDR